MAKAARIARMVTMAPEGAAGDGVQSPPSMLTTPDFAAALVIWKDLAPMVDARALLTREDRLLLAVFCVKYAACDV